MSAATVQRTLPTALVEKAGIWVGGRLAVISTNAFQTVRIDIDQFVGLEQRFDWGPAAGEQSMLFHSAKIAKPQMHHPQRRRTRDDPIRKIRILAHNAPIMFPGEIPNLRVGRILPDTEQRGNRKLGREP